MLNRLFPFVSTDVLSTSYTASERQVAYINNELAKFIEARDRLMGADRKLAIASGVEVVALGMSFSMILFLVQIGLAGAAAVYIATQVKARGELSKNFQDQLDAMLKIYRWCERVRGPSISHDPAFITVLEAIAPFVSRDDLVPWDLQRVNPDHISDQFAKVLAAPPHHLELVGLRQSSTVSDVTSAIRGFVSQAANAAADTAVPERAKLKQAESYYRMFAQSRAEFQLLVYGHVESAPTVRNAN